MHIFSYILINYLQKEGEICFRVNRGFEEQLCLYEAMQCQVDTCNPLYKQYRLTKIAEKHPNGTHTHTHKNVYICYTIQIPVINIYDIKLSTLKLYIKYVQAA